MILKHTGPKTSYDLKEPPFLTSVHDKLHKVGHADSNKKRHRDRPYVYFLFGIDEQCPSYVLSVILDITK